MSARNIIFRSKKNWFVGTLIFAWVVSTVTAFWWFQFRNIQDFDINAITNQTVFFESGELGSRLENMVNHKSLTTVQKPVSVVHFWNPDCPCNRFNEVHVKKIMSDYGAKNVQFTIVVNGKNNEQRKLREVEARKIFNHDAVVNIQSDWEQDNGPPSSPAAGVLNEQGELVYFGPYSLGANCSPDKGKFVETILDRLKDKSRRQKKQLNTLAVGCFCPWQSIS